MKAAGAFNGLPLELRTRHNMPSNIRAAGSIFEESLLRGGASCPPQAYLTDSAINRGPPSAGENPQCDKIYDGNQKRDCPPLAKSDAT
jgi:hypothetical protein